MITHLEELSINAWPALQTLLYDGWVMRYANGYSRRANSINPLYPSRLALDEKLHFCEGFYRAKKLPVVFKMTSAVFPGDLDEKLQARGYAREAGTRVQTLDLQGARFMAAEQVRRQDSLEDEWLAAFCRMSSVNTERQQTLGRMLHSLAPQPCFASISSGNQVVACGMGVLQGSSLGLFEIVTDPAFRRRGLARQVVESLLAWGQQNQARQAYLQVMSDNPPALNLYEKIGFIEQYDYWYRVMNG